MMVVYLVPEDKFEMAFAGLADYFVCLHAFGSGYRFHALRWQAGSLI